MNNLHEALKGAIEVGCGNDVPVEVLKEAQMLINKAGQIHETAKVLLEEATEARDRTEDLNQASY